MPSPRPAPLPPDALYTPCPLDHLPFETTRELEDGDGLFGQERALEAIEFGVEMRQAGHNVFVVGPPGTGRRSFLRNFLERRALPEDTPGDWCYVSDFSEPEEPLALPLPAGSARRLAAQIDEFIGDLQAAVNAAFNGDDYRNRRQAIDQQLRDAQSEAFERVQSAAAERDIRVMQTPGGLVFAPVREGEVLGPEAFNKLPAEEQRSVQAAVEEIGKLFQESMQEMPERVRATREQVRELDREVATFVIERLSANLLESWHAITPVAEWLDALKEDLCKHYAILRETEEAPLAALEMSGESDPPTVVRARQRYGVNPIVCHSPHAGAPVVFEDRPSYARMVGKIEHRAHFGTLTTDFHLIRAGALHAANGGYLILPAERLLAEPFAWDTLKRCLHARAIDIVPIEQMYGAMSTASLSPKPIPLDVKVILLGSPRTYALLSSLDPEFEDYFKVLAEFDDRTERSAEIAMKFARLVASAVTRENLLPLDRGAVARVIEEASRDVGDAERTSTELRRSIDLVREASFRAHKRGAEIVGAADVTTAIEQRERRHDRVRERVMESIERETVMIATDGTRVGQINGLAVLGNGGRMFGRPSRITARVSAGNGRIIDIEREAELGGALHTKGMMILSGYINARFSSTAPAAFAATLAFEQSYGGIDGDSASSTELYALLSALAEVPIRQSLAVTGSVNQFGEVQAIGGVTQKIEGFFDLCAARGLNGEQGVLIPKANVCHLMLREAVVEAARAGRFHIYAVEHVDQGLELLTGMPAGTADESGRFPADTVNGRVARKLTDMAEARARYMAALRGGDDDDDDTDRGGDAEGGRP